jgi:hypothetical protein
MKADKMLVQLEADKVITHEQHGKLQADINSLKQTLANVTERAQAAMSSTSAKAHKAEPPTSAFDESARAGEEEGQAEGFQELTNEAEFAANEAAMKAREQEITKIARDVVTVRELFADVADLVKDQG